MNLPSNTASNLLLQCEDTFTKLVFKTANDFYWSPKHSAVFYNIDKLSTETGQWSLFHEIAHGMLDHTNFKNDFELLRFELEAWETAKGLAIEFGIQIKQEHVEDCLDSYRDWLYARSTCTVCQLSSLQVSPHEYRCLNCNNSWQVSASRFCRPYRMNKKTSPQPKTEATFI